MKNVVTHNTLTHKELGEYCPVILLQSQNYSIIQSSGFGIVKLEIVFLFFRFQYHQEDWWMETTVKGGQAKPEPGNATSFNWWIFTGGAFQKNLLFARG